MNQVRRNNFIIASIIISVVSIAISLLVNYQIAKEYIRVDRKTQLLFGIKELFQFGYQYYVIFLGIISFTLAMFSIKSPDRKRHLYIAISLSLLAIIIVFARIWRLLV
ncbi:MAG: hypothetical protein HYX40_03200 [Sphingobacteriales bacterium]|nr:hypothetical protein [Sphingobacteriales bacterium]